MSDAGTYNTTGSSPTIATSFVTDAGTAIPAANVLNVLGGSGTSTSGTGNTVTVTVSASGFVKSILTDDGAPAVVPDGSGVLTILGGEGINVTGQGAGTTVTVTGEDASETNKGIIELATEVEAILGLDTVRAIVPLTLREVLQSPTTIGSEQPNTASFTTVQASVAGTSAAVSTVLTLNNTTQTVANGGTGTLWQLTASDGNLYSAGKTGFLGTGTWTSTASARDSDYFVETVADGVLTRDFKITNKLGTVFGDTTSNGNSGLKGVSIVFTDNTTFAAQTDIGDTLRALSIGNQSGTANTFSSLTLRNQLGGAASLMDMKWVGLAAGTPKLVFSLNDDGLVKDVLTLSSDNQVGVGTLVPSTLLDLEKAGTVTATTDFLEITNSGNAASMTNTGTAIKFNQWYYDVATPAVAASGEIAILTGQNWTSTASTQDSYLTTDIAIAGTLTRKMLLGKLGMILGTPATETARAHIGLTIANANSGTFAADTDIGDTSRSLAIYNSSATSNTFSALTLRNSVTTATDILDLKFVGNATDSNSSKLVYTWVHNSALRDVYTMTSQGGVAYRPTAAITVVAATGITNAMLARRIRVVGNTGDIDITASPQIVDGIDGQMVTFIGQNDTDTVTFDTGDGLKLEGGASITLGLGDTLTLGYDAVLDLWIEDGRSLNA